MAIASSASADLGSIPFRVDAVSALGSASYEVGVGDFSFNSELETWTWNLTAPIEMRSSSGDLVATLNMASAFYVADPIVNLGIVVQAGGSATSFTVTSGLLSFSTINPAQGKATAATTVTDGDGDGATLTGNLSGKSYQAHFNGAAPGGTVFAGLTNGMAAGSNESNSTNESFGFAGMGAVSDMSAQFSFTISANDLASGTSHFVVEAVPEPATMAVLAGGLGLLIRRRRRA